jgi:hypothetical protein
MEQQNKGGTNYQVETGANNRNFFGGNHQHIYPPTPPPVVGTPHNLPHTIATQFVGREDELNSLRARLQDSDRLAISAIQGMGGIGKTELALQYAYASLKQDHYPGGICWLRSREDVGIQIVGFARIHLDLSLPIDLDLRQQVAYCWSHWRDGTALLIWDDVIDYEAIESYLPPGGDRFQVLLTTRLDLGTSVQQLLLEVLSEAAALALLRSIVSDGRIDVQLADAKRLCEWVGCLPLGLELVGRYLQRKKDLSITTLLQRLAEKRLDARALKQTEPGMTAALGVAAAFELSWQTLSESAQQLAGWLSLFALSPIPWDLVSACLPEWDAEDLEDLRDEALLGLHLLERTAPRLYQLHQLLREFFAAKRHQMAIEAEMKRSVCRVLVNAARQIPQILTLTLVAQFTPLIPHLAEVSTRLTTWLTDEDLIEPYLRIAQFYEEQAAYEQAEPWLTQSCTLAETRLGADHPDTASSLNNLAGLYRAIGRYNDAEPLYLQSLQITEQQLGADHPDTARSLNNLAELYRAIGRYSDAEPLYLQSLQIHKQQLGTDHPDTASSLNNLALLYQATGRYSDAEPLLVRSLQIHEQQLGADHPTTATSLNNLAGLYRATGRHCEAKPLLVQSLQIREIQLGACHPDTASSLNNLAGLYRAIGRYSDAEPLLVRSLQIHEQQLGADHPTTALSLNNLALLYHATKRYSDAEPLLVRSLQITEQQLGANHPTTANSLHSLALLYQATGHYSDAESLLVRSLQITEQQLGADHPDTATSLNNLAELYRAAERYSEAEPLYLRAVEILFDRLGETHPTFQTVWGNFIRFLKGAIKAGQPAQLSDHPTTQSVLDQLRNRE